MFLPPILIPACNLSNPAFLMMCSAYKLKNRVTADRACSSFSVLLFMTVSAASTKPNTYVVVSTHLRSDNDWMDESVKSGGSSSSTEFQP